MFVFFFSPMTFEALRELFPLEKTFDTLPVTCGTSDEVGVITEIA